MKKTLFEYKILISCGVAGGHGSEWSQDGHGIMTCSGADYIARLLAVNGIDVVFGMTGG